MILFLHPVTKLLRAFHFYLAEEQDVLTPFWVAMPSVSGFSFPHVILVLILPDFDTLQCPVSRAFHFYGIPPQHQ